VFGAKMSEAETNGRKTMTNALNRNAAGVVSGHAALAPFGSVISSFMATQLDDRPFEYETFIGTNRTGCDGLPSLHVGDPTATRIVYRANSVTRLIQSRSELIKNGQIRATVQPGIDRRERRTTARREGDNVFNMPVKQLNKLTPKIGFIGLGLMGSRLARRLHAAGWNIRAWNRSSQPATQLKKEGIVTAPSVASLVAGSDVILSSLANDEAVRSVYLDKGGLLSQAEPGTIILEMSTISPDLSRRLHWESGTKGLNFLDVAISGSTPAVEAGTVTLLAGGEKETFEQCIPIFESIAKQWFLIGPGSSGVQMKLVVNLLLGIDMQAIAEAVSLGEHLQIDRNVLLDVLSKTAVIAPAMAGKFRKIKNSDYSPEFPLRLMSKDMDLVMDTARKSGADLPAASAAQAVLASSISTSGDLDLSAITVFVLGKGMRTAV
jgi:3-hydroxyisobutyrate dehydrogenase